MNAIEIHLPGEQITEAMLDGLRVALDNYQNILTMPLEGKAGLIKKFGEREDACRKTLAHIQLLLKLAVIAGLPNVAAKNHNNQIVLAALIQESETEVRNYGEVEEKSDSPE